MIVKRKYPKNSKIAMVGLALAIAMLFGVMLYMVDTLPDSPMNMTTAYEDTQTFGEQLVTCIYNEIQKIHGQILFDDGSADDSGQTVNIVETLNWTDWNTTDGRNYDISILPDEPVVYRASDLKKWYEEEAIADPDESRVIVCKGIDERFHYYTQKDFYDMLREKELSCIMNGETLNAQEMEKGNVLNEDQEDYSMIILDKEGKLLYTNCWAYNGNSIVEQYAPVGKKSLLDVVNTSDAWNGKLEVLYQCLSDALNLAQIDDNRQKEESNVSYLYIDLDRKKIYSTNPKWSSFAQYETYLAEILSNPENKSVIYHRQKMEMDTNCNGIRLSLWDESAEKENVIIAAMVDTTYPVDDFWKENHDRYVRYQKLLKVLLPFTLAGGIGFILLMICLTVCAGRTSEDEEIHLNRYDHWKTELGAVSIIIFWLVSLLIGKNIVDIFADASWFRRVSGRWAILYALFMVHFMACFLTGYLSLVRRIKGRTLWSNSICKMIWEFVRTKVPTVRNWVKVLIVFMIGGFIQTLAIIGDEREWWILLLLLMELIIAGYVFWYLRGRRYLDHYLESMASGARERVLDQKKLTADQRREARLLGAIQEGIDEAVEEKLQSERMKTELITNVSHDLKTPLTSIINYVDLMRKEKIDNPKVQEYLQVLDVKSQRLKTLTEDIVEASRASSGNVRLEMMDIDLAEMIRQVQGEFEERMEVRKLQYSVKIPETEIMIHADGRCMWRIIANLYSNVSKYAMPGSRVYAEVAEEQNNSHFSIKNISEQELNISPQELTERFVRGDRSRLTDGSGLGLSIAKSLTELQGGRLEITIDGDLFRADVIMPKKE